jgi:hypothetical protein
MLSAALSRAFAAIVLMALLATVAGAAQCVVRCASPVSTPCPHHSNSRHDAPTQLCGSEMLPGYKASIVNAEPLVGPVVAAPAEALAFSPNWQLSPAWFAAPAAHCVLRI